MTSAWLLGPLCAGFITFLAVRFGHFVYPLPLVVRVRLTLAAASGGMPGLGRGRDVGWSKLMVGVVDKSCRDWACFHGMITAQSSTVEGRWQGIVPLV